MSATLEWLEAKPSFLPEGWRADADETIKHLSGDEQRIALDLLQTLQVVEEWRRDAVRLAGELERELAVK